MIDQPPAMPPAQVIAQRLVDCGLDKGAVTVTWHDAMEGVAIVVREGTRVSAGQMPCIYTAADSNLVIFEDPALQATYDGYAAEQGRPQLLASIAGEVAQMGLADDFPRRAAYASTREYADALERHAGLPTGAFAVAGRAVTFAPPPTGETMAEFEKIRRAMAVLAYATAIGDLDGIGFVGNAAR